jgi:hypothetical protein
MHKNVYLCISLHGLRLVFFRVMLCKDKMIIRTYLTGGLKGQQAYSPSTDDNVQQMSEMTLFSK